MGTAAWHTKPPLGARLNSSHPLAKGLIGHWLFNERGGLRALDSSGRGHHATPAVGATPGWGAVSRIGAGVSMPSPNALDVPTTSHLVFVSGDRITVSIWAHPAALSTARGLMAKNCLTITPANYIFYLTAIPSFDLLYTDNTDVTNHHWRSTVAPPSGALVHIVFDWVFAAGGNPLCFINGQPSGGSWVEGTGTVAPTTHDGPFELGRHPDFGVIDGSLFHVALWKNRLAFTTRDALLLYRHPYAMLQPWRRRSVRLAVGTRFLLH